MLTVTDQQELLALNRALMEVRYLADDVDDATRGSRFLADLHERLVEAITASLREAGEDQQLADWEQWRRFDAREREPRKIIEHLSPVWPRLNSPAVKRDVLVNQVRPFSYTEADIADLMSRLDQTAAG